MSDTDKAAPPAAGVNQRLLQACRMAAEWLEGWATAEPYLSTLHKAIAEAEQELAAPPARAPECVIVCQQSVDCSAWPNGACEQGCAQAERAAQAGDELPPLPEPHVLNVPQLEDENWHAYTADQMRTYALAARGAQAGDERDAARYRWLRANGYVEVRCDSPRDPDWRPEHLDAAIDAAPSQEGKG